MEHAHDAVLLYIQCCQLIIVAARRDVVSTSKRVHVLKKVLASNTCSAVDDLEAQNQRDWLQTYGFQ